MQVSQAMRASGHRTSQKTSAWQRMYWLSAKEYSICHTCHRSINHRHLAIKSSLIKATATYPITLHLQKWPALALTSSHCPSRLTLLSEDGRARRLTRGEGRAIGLTRGEGRAIGLTREDGRLTELILGDACRT